VYLSGASSAFHNFVAVAANSSAFGVAHHFIAVAQSKTA